VATRGMIAIMGSGETTDSMVRVHRNLLDQLTPPGKAVFIDTPAGFQMNVADLYEKAREYFKRHFNQPLDLVSFKNAKEISSFEAERAFQTLREGNYIFVGPGSPTYALKNWVGSPIPRILADRIGNGACFVAASAAALTLGQYTLPVYEIYKVGEEVRWVEGLNLLARFGINLVVIPHWNNAEGGTHDTRFCYMGESRLARLEALLPPGSLILGVDEHTACILDFGKEKAWVQGIGRVILHQGDREKFFQDGQTIPFDDLQKTPTHSPPEPRVLDRETLDASGQTPGMDRLESLAASAAESLQRQDGAAVGHFLFEMEKIIWEAGRKAAPPYPSEERAREIFRNLLLQLICRWAESPKDPSAVLAPVLNLLLDVREKLRQAKLWEISDALRHQLLQQGILIEDTAQGPRWVLKAEKPSETQNT